MLAGLLGWLSMFGHKFGLSGWIGDSWQCLTLLAEILCELFSTFYPLAVGILFQIMVTNQWEQGRLPPVQKILQFDGQVSQLRLHPNHLVTGSSAATYIFLLQHGNYGVVQLAVTSFV
jgi:PI-3-kinase-related kinase SMG-1